MTSKKGEKEESAFDFDIDSLLETLSPDDLVQLGKDLIDPDDSMVPPNQRCAYHVDKKATGNFSRKQLLEFLEKKGREEKDWDEAKPFKKEKRGKVFVPKKEEEIRINDDADVETEWDEVLQNASEEELVDLAAILGFHGMLNQVQYHQAFVENREILGGGGFRGCAKHEDFKLYKDEGFNDTDVDEALNKVKANDAKLKELNLNNIKNISLERLVDFAEALESNTNLTSLHMANTRATDRVAKAFTASLKVNKTLTSLNLESNYISGDAICDMLDSIHVHQTLLELRVANQRPSVLGNKVEMKISTQIRLNTKMLKFGIHLEVPGARVMIGEYLKRNNDNIRRGRRGEDLIEAPPADPLIAKYLSKYKKKEENMPAMAALSRTDGEEEEETKKKEEPDTKAAPTTADKEEESEEESEEEDDDTEEESDEE